MNVKGWASVALVAVAGCVHPLLTDRDLWRISSEVSSFACPENRTTVRDYRRGKGSQRTSWTIGGCGQELECDASVGPQGSSFVAVANCAETRASFLNRLKLAAATATDCAEFTDVKPSSGEEWNIKGCDREWDCRGIEGGTSCRETPDSRERTQKKVAIDRLHVETACPREQISVDIAAEWTAGQERAYRLTACGKTYTCTQSPGRTECRPALANEKGAPPHPEAKPTTEAAKPLPL